MLIKILQKITVLISRVVSGKKYYLTVELRSSVIIFYQLKGCVARIQSFGLLIFIQEQINEFYGSTTARDRCVGNKEMFKEPRYRYEMICSFCYKRIRLRALHGSKVQYRLLWKTTVSLYYSKAFLKDLWTGFVETIETLYCWLYLKAIAAGITRLFYMGRKIHLVMYHKCVISVFRLSFFCLSLFTCT